MGGFAGTVDLWRSEFWKFDTKQLFPVRKFQEKQGKMLRFFVIFTVFALAQGLTPSSFLTPVDKGRIKGLFVSNLNDQSSVSYAILGLKLLGETIPNVAELCKVLQANIDKPEATGDAIFAATSAAKALGSCTLKPNAAVTKVLKLESSVQELYQGTLSQLNLGQKICQSCVAKSLTDALKKDDGIASLGMAFNLAANLDKKEGAAIFERIEDAIVQADEINGKNLQFEGGLSVSSSVISGAYALAKTVGKAPIISKLQSVKFANYFLSRKNVQQVKGAWSLLTALQTMSSNDFHIPVAITLASQPSVSDASPKVKVQITDVMGGDLGAMDVQVDSAMRQTDGAVVMSKSKMKAAGDASFYEIDLMAVSATDMKIQLNLNGQQQIITVLPGEFKVIRHNGVQILHIQRYEGNVYSVHAVQENLMVSFDGKHAQIFGTPLLRGRSCGLCGNLDAEITADLKTPERCIMSRPRFAAYSYMIQKSCEGIPSQDLAVYQQEKTKCVKQEIIPTTL